MWEPNVESTIREIPSPAPDEPVDAILRIDFPHRLDTVPGVRTFVFMTAEYGFVPNRNFAGGRSLAEWHRESDCFLITPSQWSKHGLLASGADEKRVFVIPHGVDTFIFHPLPEEQRAIVRKKIGASGFCFLNIGAMTGSKNIAMLLKAFAAVAGAISDTKLVLKGLDMLYGSERMLREYSSSLTPAESQLLQGRIAYLGRPFSFRQMAELYQACDAYVTPYAGEGFNMPALEAVASGLPLICTKGGPTDDFTTSDFARYIDSTERPFTMDNQTGSMLVPSFDHLVQQMMKVIEESTTKSGPQFVAEHFSWKRVVDKLIAVLNPN